MTQVAFPNVPPGQTVIGMTNMKYVDLAKTKSLIGYHRDGAVLIRMIETYDPYTQAVVLAQIEGENAISVKMRLDLPFVVDA